ncbi:helix-turn-helix domain-containing protein [Actinomadura craniellae]|nr:helix-turn-helix transcriptional regulator [Actinomadura craniellae]
MLGGQLRRLREARGMSREEAGQAIRVSRSEIGRVELGHVRVGRREVSELLTLYGIDDERERASVLDLVRQGGVPGWWHQYGDVLPDWFETYVGLEEAADTIRTYEVQFVPGLLQHEDYARAVALLMFAQEPTENVDRRVALRMARQRLLTRPDGPQLQCVVDEAALRRPLGGRRVLRAQLEHLIEVCALPNVTLQIVPFDADIPMAVGCPFTILRFAEPALPDVVYLEQLTSALYLDAPADVADYTHIMGNLKKAAHPPSDTRSILHNFLAEL